MGGEKSPNMIYFGVLLHKTPFYFINPKPSSFYLVWVWNLFLNQNIFRYMFAHPSFKIIIASTLGELPIIWISSNNPNTII
ncbi:hypothetical protein BpHYR1_004303 [Brachionus plicatilis]|uniref:Uncharacterized protein n=1 Tax=Brachionus plicatilis TaxID=10195 RepID=A0A3M7QRZ0_BRAPC|nr:hypothetical protein BpHYR1_004303 [Brachionus plicatilis]